jgi:hypothetical protein
MAAGSESHQFDRTTAWAADAMRVGLRRTAHGEGDPQALHELLEAAKTVEGGSGPQIRDTNLVLKLKTWAERG